MISFAPLDEVCQFVLDGTHASPERAEQGIPVLSAQNVTGGRLHYQSDRYTTQSEYDIFRRRVEIQSGDVLLTIVGTIGRAAIVTLCRPAVFQRSVAVLRPKEGVLDSRFLFHATQSPDFQHQLARATNQSSQAGVYLGKLGKTYVPLPCIAEQRRISDILDRAEALRAKRRTALANLDTLAQSIFLDLFGDPATNPKQWPQRSLGDVAVRFSDGPFGSNLKTAHYTPSGIRVIRLQNIGVGEFVDDDKVYICENHFGELKKHECRPGDILIGTLGDPNLRACIQPAWLHTALNKADCVQLRVNEQVTTAAYVCALLNQPSTQKLAQGLILGQTRLRISMGRLRGLFIPVPPVPLQQEFTAAIVTLQKLKTVHRASLVETDRLLAALQCRAFQGELISEDQSLRRGACDGAVR